MPILKTDFSPSLPFKNGHFSTIYRALFTKTAYSYQRKRITTHDTDFIDLDFSTVGSNTIAILTHGLEGSSKSNYILTALKKLNSKNIDTVSFNLRGCSGENNLLLGTYHSGKTEDLETVINYILKNYDYENILLIGYSLGGNMTLKYMGEYAEKQSHKIKGAIAVSVPIDLESSGKEMSKWNTKLYMSNFLKTLKVKVLQKSKEFPDFKLDEIALQKAKNFTDFDEIYTAPVFGFKNAKDYWKKASAKPYLSKIKKPTLLVTSLDDPFLSSKCYPFKEAENSKYFYLEVTKYGGHVGFISSFVDKKNDWLEQRIFRFIKKNSNLKTIKTISSGQTHTFSSCFSQ